MFGLENELQKIAFHASTQGKKYFGHAPPKSNKKLRKKNRFFRLQERKNTYHGL